MSEKTEITTPFFRRALHREFDRRKEQTGHYTLRSFARDLEVLPSKLSQYLNGTSGISTETANKIADQMQLAGLEKELFVTSAEAFYSRNRATREMAQNKMRGLLQNNYSELADDTFTMVRDWYHIAILQLTELPKFQPNHAWIGKALNVPEDSVAEAVERLERLGLLDRSTIPWRSTNKLLETQMDFVSEAAREFQRQVMSLTRSRLEEVPVEKREVSAAIFTLDSNLIPEMKTLLRQFHKEAILIASRSERKNTVYNLNFQFMPLYEET